MIVGLVPATRGDVLLDDRPITRLRMHLDAQLVPHGAARDEERILLPQQPGDTPLQQVHGGIFPVHVVTYFRFRHDPAHPRRRTRNGVAAQIDDHASHNCFRFFVKYACPIAATTRIIPTQREISPSQSPCSV